MANRILVSWLDDRLDFEDKKPSKPAFNGPNMHFHRYFFDNYDFHLLLYWKEIHRDYAKIFSKAVAEKKLNHHIEPVFVGIQDPIDLAEVKQLTEQKLLEYKEATIDIFINPGYQMMQISWYICHTTLGLKTRLLQIRKPEFNEDGLPRLEEIQTERSTEAYTMMLHTRKVQQAPGLHDIPPQLCIPKGVKKVYERAKHLAYADQYPVLIEGASGSGKEFLAQYIHANSPRRKTYFKVNCAAFSDELLRSELFGHEKGAFTGAQGQKKGFFEEADGGSLLLDEIGDISPFTQVALLRILQEGTFFRVGGTEQLHTNVRVIAASHKELPALIDQGSFRHDLYFRLAVGRLKLPAWVDLPVGERHEVLDHMLAHRQGQNAAPKRLQLSKEARKYLADYAMPGNFRQLENIINRLYIFYSKEKEISLAQLQEEMSDNPMQQLQEANPENWKEVEKSHLEKMLKRYSFNISRTHKVLGYGSENTLRKKIKEYGIILPEKDQ